MYQDYPITHRPLTQWWTPDLLAHLPLPRQLGVKTATQVARLQAPEEPMDDYYRPFELTVLQDLFAFSEISHSVRDYMPNFTTDFSPFSARVRLGKKREEMSSSKTNLAAKNPSVAGNSTSSTTSTEEDSDESVNDNNTEDDDDGVAEDQDIEGRVEGEHSRGREGGIMVSFDTMFPSMKTVYGVELGPPSSRDLQLYRRTAALSRSSGPLQVASSRRLSSTALPHPLARPLDRSGPCPVPTHDYSKQLLRTVSKESLKVYERHVKVGREGAQSVSQESLEIFRRYVAMAGTA